jgi:hypothetical protein
MRILRRANLPNHTIVTNLNASHFRLTDNGIEQKVSVEQTENEPLGVVIVMQTGGRPPVSFRATAISNRKVALVTFDSRSEQIWLPEKNSWRTATPVAPKSPNVKNIGSVRSRQRPSGAVRASSRRDQRRHHGNHRNCSCEHHRLSPWSFGP